LTSPYSTFGYIPQGNVVITRTDFLHTMWELMLVHTTPFLLPGRCFPCNMFGCKCWISFITGNIACE
jgi:hypothetical protein